MLALFAVGAVGLVLVGRRQSPSAARRFGRALALVLLALVIGSHAYALTTFDIGHVLPLQLSDLAGFVAIYALWSHRQWAYSLIYYWGLTLSVQALSNARNLWMSVGRGTLPTSPSAGIE